MWQLTMYCHWRPPDAMPLLTQNVFGASGRPNFDGYIYMYYAAPPYSARISAIYFLPFCNVWLGSVSVCNAWESQCRIYEGWVRTLILFQAVCGPKFTKFSEDVGSLLYFPTPFSNCLCHLSFRRYSPLSLEILEKPSKCKSFSAPNCCRRDDSDFSTAVC